jgi:hypothetical protein
MATGPSVPPPATRASPKPAAHARFGRVRALTTDLTQEASRPYFLWDEDTSISEFRAALSGADSNERQRLLGKMLREARDSDVWLFVTPREVAAELPALSRHLGRRRAFWAYLIGRWRAHGLVP